MIFFIVTGHRCTLGEQINRFFYTSYYSKSSFMELSPFRSEVN
jgi:hypothetical protein